MGQYRTPAPVRLVVGILARDSELASKTLLHLEKEYGPSDLQLRPFPFCYTNYYQQELGDKPVRAFYAAETLIERERIVDIKRHTNELELEWAALHSPGLRSVNLDPGYMTLGQFFLATTKDQRQRVYIRDGIFVEPTLYFQNGRFHPFDWTYRDYQSPEYIGYFERLRERLAYQHSTGRPYSQRQK